MFSAEKGKRHSLVWRKRDILSLFWIIIGAFIVAAAIEYVTTKYGIIPAGFTGVALLAEMLWGGSWFLIVLWTINIPLLLFSWFNIGKKHTVYAFAYTIMLPLIRMILPEVDPFIDVSEQMVVILFGSIFYGLGIAIILRSNGSTGGTDFISTYISNKLNKPFGVVSKILNLSIISAISIILLTRFDAYNLENLMYTFIFIWILSIAIDNFYPISKKIKITIITQKIDEVKKALHDHVGHRAYTFNKSSGTQSENWTIDIVVGYTEYLKIVKVLQKEESASFIYSTLIKNTHGKFYKKDIE